MGKVRNERSKSGCFGDTRNRGAGKAVPKAARSTSFRPSLKETAIDLAADLAQRKRDGRSFKEESVLQVRYSLGKETKGR